MLSVIVKTCAGCGATNLEISGGMEQQTKLLVAFPKQMRGAISFLSRPGAGHHKTFCGLELGADHSEFLLAKCGSCRPGPKKIALTHPGPSRMLLQQITSLWRSLCRNDYATFSVLRFRTLNLKECRKTKQRLNTSWGNHAFRDIFCRLLTSSSRRKSSWKQNQKLCRILWRQAVLVEQGVGNKFHNG